MNINNKTIKEVRDMFPDGFIVTGLYYNSSKRFSNKYSSLIMAMTINLWRGSVWGVKDGKRTLLKRVWN